MGVAKRDAPRKVVYTSARTSADDLSPKKIHKQHQSTSFWGAFVTAREQGLFFKKRSSSHSQASPNNKTSNEKRATPKAYERRAIKHATAQERLVEAPESAVVVPIVNDKDVGVQVEEVYILQGDLKVPLLQKSPCPLGQTTKIEPDELEPIVLFEKRSHRLKLVTSHVRVVG